MEVGVRAPGPIRSALVGAAVLVVVKLGVAGPCIAQDSPMDRSTARPSAAQPGSPPERLEKELAAGRQQEIRRLRKRLDAVERRLDEQIEALTQMQAQLEAAQAEAAPPPPERAPPAKPARVSRAARPAPRNANETHHKAVRVSFGGFVAGDYVRRSIDTANDIATAYNGDYFRNDPLAHTSQSLFSVRRSSLWALVKVDPAPHTQLKAFGEIDFLGAAQTSTSVKSDSYNPELKQLYGVADWEGLHLHLLVGQAWSLVTLNRRGISPDSVVRPPTIDGNYLPGFIWARQPQIRLTQDIDRRAWVALSLENPQTTFYTGPNPLPSGVNLLYETHGTGLGFNTQDTLSLNHIPDAVLKVAGDASLGEWTVHIEAFGLYRSFYERLNYKSRSVAGTGLGAGLLLPLVPRWLDLQVSGMVGRGVGRYGTAQLPDVTFDPKGVIRPIRELIAMAGLTLHPLRRLDIYIFAGQEKESRQAYNFTDTSGATSTVVPYGYGNFKYSNAGCASETSTSPCVGNLRLVEQATVGLWYEPYTGNFGTVRWGLQLSRTEFKAFAGVGGAPVATLNMVSTSFRYYPVAGW